MHVTEYRPGEDELINYRAYRRKRAYGVGTGEGGPVGESYHPEKGTHRKGVTPGYDFKHKTITDPSNPKHKSKVHVIQGETKKDVDEALTFAQRLARKRSFRKFRAKVKRGREIAKRKILSREKLIFNSLAKEIKIIYPDLNEFEVFETIKTDFNEIDTVLVFNLRWNKELEKEEKLKLDENVRNWLKFQLDNDVFEIRSNTN